MGIDIGMDVGLKYRTLNTDTNGGRYLYTHMLSYTNDIDMHVEM